VFFSFAASKEFRPSSCLGGDHSLGCLHRNSSRVLQPKTFNVASLQSKKHNRYSNLKEVDGAFREWQHVYNTQRPHEALNMDTPIKHYSQSHRSYPEILIPVEYNYSDTIRKINSDGKLSVQGIVFTISRALEGQYIALRATEKDGIIDVFYCHQKIETLDLRGR